jgi:hypothetical protein
VQDVTRLLQRLVQPDAGRGDAAGVVLVTFFDVVRAEEELAGTVERIAAEGESVQVGVSPGERGL